MPAVRAWTEALSQALKLRGFASLTEYADSLPAVSLADLASDLGGEPMALGQRLSAEAETTGTMERCARSLFARDFRGDLPEGWQPVGGDRSDEATSQEFQLAGIFLTLLTAFPEAYHDAIERVERAMCTMDLPSGWLPEGADDPALIELFGSCWQVVPM
jgi:hypothetical protein